MNPVSLAFDQLSFDEMMLVDGGAWGWRQWTACGLIIGGAACAIVGIYCPVLWGIPAKAWSAAGVILSASGGVLAIG